MTDDEADATHNWVPDTRGGSQDFYCKNCLANRDLIKSSEGRGPIPCPHKD